MIGNKVNNVRRLLESASHTTGYGSFLDPFLVSDICATALLIGSWQWTDSGTLLPRRAAKEIGPEHCSDNGYTGWVLGREEIDGGYKYTGERTEFVNVGVASQNAAWEDRQYMVQSTQNGYAICMVSW